jgi:hypothetical protein
MTSAVRAAIIFIPSLIIAIWLGAQIGSREYLIPCMVGAVVLFAFALAILLKGARIEAYILGFLIAGYFVGNRGFAAIAPVQPFYIGEIGLAVALICVLLHHPFSRRFDEVRHPLPRLLLAFLFYGIVRAAFDFQDYKMDTLRDLALVYYCLFFFVAAQIGNDQRALRVIETFVKIAALGLLLVIPILTYRPESIERFSIKGVPLIVEKGDLVSIFAAVLAIFLTGQRALLGSRLFRSILILAFFGFVFAFGARASLLGLLAGAVPFWLAGQRKIFVYATASLVAGVFIIVATLSLPALRTNETFSSKAAFEDRYSSMFDWFSTKKYNSELGDIKAGANEFRRYFWTSVIRQTNSVNPVFGRGFGYDFLPEFQSYYRGGDWTSTRSPHNYFVTVYGRMGIVGILLWVAILSYMIRGTLRCARAVRLGEEETRPLIYWSCAWVILVSAAFGVVLEGPMGAVPFWTFLGIAHAHEIARIKENRRPVTERHPVIPHLSPTVGAS